MGKKNRERRAAKARDRQRRAGGRATRTSRDDAGDADERWVTMDAFVRDLVDLAPIRLAAGDRPFAEEAATKLSDCPRFAVLRVVEDELVRAVDRLLRSGWQPSEVMRQVRRSEGVAHSTLTATAIIAQHACWPAGPIDTRWQMQLDIVRAAAVKGDDDRSHGWFFDWCRAARLERRSALVTSMEVLAIIRPLPPLEELIPPPGRHVAVDAAHLAKPNPSDDERQLLERVRNLLGKAESTEFDAEAEAFTAKAHELITRHAIDVALVAGSVDGSVDDEPSVTRIDIDDPYADAKSLLLQIVAEANRCRSVFQLRLAFSTVLGFPTDLAATEMLYTSLLVQGQAALAAAGRNAPPGARTRSRSYRAAFLVAYANRIGQRLEDINEHLVADAGSAGALPVLRSREAAVDDALAARFPELTSSAVRSGYDAAGWAGGRLAADQARLNLADLDDRSDDDVLEPAALASARQ